jgi:hypothetical protein
MLGPDFFIVGGPKCGTTALHSYLAQHPAVFMATKELFYFGLEGRHVTEREYLAAFSGGSGAARRGDATVRYLASRSACEEIAATARDARIIVMVRDPVEAIASMHADAVFAGMEVHRSLAEALRAESERRARVPLGQTDYLLYREQASWDVHLERYKAAFERVHVVVYDDFAANTLTEYQRVLRFLGVDETHTPPTPIVNPRKMARSGAIRHAIGASNSPRVKSAIRAMLPLGLRRGLARQVMRANAVPADRSIDPGVAESLMREMKPGVERLESILGRDLSAWKTKWGRVTN